MEYRLIFALSLSSLLVGSVWTQEWRPIGLTLRRTLGSVNSAVEYLGGRYKRVLSAYELVNDIPGWDFYWVSFIAEFPGGIMKQCQAQVLWTSDPLLNRTVYNARCQPAVPEH